MSILPIRVLGDPILREETTPVAEITDEIRTLVANMFETMYLAKGIGLAAPQVGRTERVAVIDVDGAKFAIINPEIVSSDSKTAKSEEGCLSIPDVYGDVERPARVTVRALDIDGKEFEIEADELLGRCLQHEIDHLHGKLFLDYMSVLKRRSALNKWAKEKDKYPGLHSPPRGRSVARPRASGRRVVMRRVMKERHRCVKILFWGTPDFALPPLRALIGEGVRRRRRRHAAGQARRTLALDARGAAGQESGAGRRHSRLPTRRPRGDEFIAQISALEPDISVVVAYGHILSQQVIDLPRLGTINIHASLLPKLRGAGPIQASILQGDTETGVTIMRMVKALDAGPSILQVRTPIPDDETYGELQMRLAEMGAMALIEALALISIGQATETPQNDADATYAPKIDRTMTRVNWAADARAVARTIRAFDPKPGAFTQCNGGDVKLFGARRSSRDQRRARRDPRDRRRRDGRRVRRRVPYESRTFSRPANGGSRRWNGSADGASRSGSAYLSFVRHGPIIFGRMAGPDQDRRFPAVEVVAAESRRRTAA